MKNEMIWGYMLSLSNHLWADESTTPKMYMPVAYDENIAIDMEAWDKMVAFLAERKYNLVLVDVCDGMKYESHPEISAPNAWDKDLLKKKLNEMRALGIVPIPKLNFSTCHDTWMKEYRRMVSTPIYYRVCADLIKEVCEVFDSPRLFHLGFDEETAVAQKINEMIVIRCADLWWHDLFFLCKEVEKYGARPWVWSDYVWNNRESFLKNMSKDILQSNWFYSLFTNYGASYPSRQTAIDTYELLEKHGFDQVPTGSTFSCWQNQYQTVAHCKEKVAPERLKGFLSAPWMATTNDTFYNLANCAHYMYLARKAHYPEGLV
ncbi:MAG: Tat pathway signal protein [Clostridia bacterium]|nr:Tat pathway signal protein [Clostridia bacterium]